MNPGTTMTAAAMTATSSAPSVPDGAAASDLERLGEEVRPLRHAPTDHDAGYGADGEQAGPAVGIADQQDERRDATGRRHEHQRECLGGQLVEQVAGVGSQNEDSDERRQPGDDAGHHRPTAEVVGHRLVTQPAGIPHQVHRGQVGDDDDRQHAAEHGCRVDPAVPRVAGDAAGRNASRRDRPGDCAKAVGDDH